MKRNEKSREKRLTKREREVIVLAASSNRQTALRLGVGEQRVKNVWTAVYRKLGVTGGKGKRIRALTTALREGVVSLSEIASGDRRYDE